MTTKSQETADLNIARFRDITTISNHPFMGQDLARFMLGDKIAEGSFRAVFEFDFIPNTVIKVAGDTEANTNEFNTWAAIAKTPHAKWFAPCLFLSPCGHFLVQRKVRPIKPGDKLPKTMPRAFTDFKKENYGWLGKQFVCHDYQFISPVLECGLMARIKVKWK